MIMISHWIKKIQNWISSKQKILARNFKLYNSLPWAGGIRAVFAFRDGIIKAEQYRKWDDWSLTYSSISYITELIIKEKIERVVEFGAGYSTIVLAEFLRQISSVTQIDSFEHQAGYAQQISNYLPKDSVVTVHCADLIQVSDDIFDKLFTSSDPYGDFITSAVPVPEEQYQETRLRNVFYRFDFRLWEPKNIDLVILDGPNGNGRSLAFPLLKNNMRFPSWVLIDDYLDYPFLDDLKRIFDIKLLHHVEAENKEWVLVMLKSVW